MRPRTRTALLAAGCAAGLLVAADARAQAAPPRILSFVETLDGDEQHELRWPMAVAAASSDEIAVADGFEPRLLRFRKVGVSWQLDGVAALPGVPEGLVWDGTRYVASLRQGRGLAAFEGEGLLQRRLPLPRGVEPGPLAASPDGGVLVYDHASGRVLSLSSESGAGVAIPGQVTALAPGAGGGFFAAVATTGSVVRVDAAGNLAATWKLPGSDGIPAWPVGLAVEPGGDVVVVDRHAGRLLILDASGEVVGVGSRPGSEPGLLREPLGLARLPEGLLVVVDQGNGRLQVFRRTD